MTILSGFSLLLTVSAVGAPLPPSAPMSMVDKLPSPFKAELKQPLSLGSSGSQVKILEEKLADLSMLPASSVDRIFDQATFEAVRAFQKSERLPVDGSVGASTWRKLRFASTPLPRRGGEGRHAEVWLDRQLLILVEDSAVVRVVQVSTGQPGLDTPTGSWPVYLKDPNAFSRQYSAPMPWASYYSGGYALHQSDSVPEFPASHGCTRVPAVFAEEVFNWLSVGDRVYVLA